MASQQGIMHKSSPTEKLWPSPYSVTTHRNASVDKTTRYKQSTNMPFYVMLDLSDMKLHVSTKRRGISGLMQVAMIMGIVVIFAGVLVAFASEIFTTYTMSDSIAIQQLYIHNADGATYLSVNVKNTGNHDLQTVALDIMVDIDSTTAGLQPHTTTITPLPLSPGITGSAYEKLEDSGGADLVLPAGKEVALVLKATSVDGSIISEPTTVRVK